MKGITETDLVAERDKAVIDIEALELEEKQQSSLAHTALAEKSRLKAEVVKAKNRLAVYDEVLGKVTELKAEATSGPRL